MGKIPPPQADEASNEVHHTPDEHNIIFAVERMLLQFFFICRTYYKKEKN